MSEVVNYEEVFYTNITRFNDLDRPQEASYTLSYRKDLIHNIDKFKVSVERLYVSTSEIPIADLTGKTLNFTIKKNAGGTTASRNIMDFYTSSSSSGDKILRNYYDLCFAFNKAIKDAISTLGFGGIHISVHFKYDPQLKGILVLFEEDYIPDVVGRPYELLMSQDVYNLFGVGFPYVFNESTGYYQFNALSENTNYTLEPIMVSGTLESYYKVVPEETNMYNWHDCDRIILTTSIPVFAEVVSTMKFGGTEENTGKSILTDFHYEPHNDRNGVLYNANGNGRPINIVSGDSLTSFSITLYYGTKDGKIRPVSIRKGANFDIKLKFQRNTF